MRSEVEWEVEVVVALDRFSSSQESTVVNVVEWCSGSIDSICAAYCMALLELSCYRIVIADRVDKEQTIRNARLHEVAIANHQ